MRVRDVIEDRPIRRTSVRRGGTMIQPSMEDPNLNVEIELLRQGRSVTHPSRILRVEDRVLHLTLPFEGNLPLGVTRGQRIVVHLKTEDGVWRFPARVLGARLTPRPTLTVRRIGGLTHVERRRYAREDVRIQPKYFMLLDRWRNRGYPLPAMILNIGGGGVLFISPYEVPVGETVRMVLELPDGFGEVKATGTVVGNRLAPEFGPGINAMRVAFTQISDAHREAIIRFVLHRQAQKARAKWEQSG